MSELLSRKAFFGQLVHELTGLSRDLLSALAPTPPPLKSAPPDPLWSDFSPAMLADEAASLGLDLQGMDRDQLLRTIQERMRKDPPAS